MKDSVLKDRAELILTSSTNPDEEGAGADRVEDIEELAATTSAFEEIAFKLKQSLNEMEVASAKATALPTTLRLCFQ